MNQDPNNNSSNQNNPSPYPPLGQDAPLPSPNSYPGSTVTPPSPWDNSVPQSTGFPSATGTVAPTSSIPAQPAIGAPPPAQADYSSFGSFGVPAVNSDLGGSAPASGFDLSSHSAPADNLPPAPQPSYSAGYDSRHIDQGGAIQGAPSGVGAPVQPSQDNSSPSPFTTASQSAGTFPAGDVGIPANPINAGNETDSASSFGAFPSVPATDTTNIPGGVPNVNTPTFESPPITAQSTDTGSFGGAFNTLPNSWSSMASTAPLPDALTQPSAGVSEPAMTMPTPEAPTDLSHLIGNQPVNGPVIAEPQQQQNFVVPQPPIQQPTSIANDDGVGVPKWLIFTGVGILLLVAAASAYFILGVGKSSSPAMSEPTVDTLTNPPVVRATSTPIPTPLVEASGSSLLTVTPTKNLTPTKPVTPTKTATPAGSL